MSIHLSTYKSIYPQIYLSDLSIYNNIHSSAEVLFTIYLFKQM